jgi:ubiquinone/menaquinone biosynthesis C-methylase UbiE
VAVSDRSNVPEQVRFYEQTAGRFDRSVWSLGNRDNRNHVAKITAVARALRLDRAGRVLEVGAGTGLHARWILENTGASYSGIDVSRPMLEIAARRVEPFGGRAVLSIADAHRLPFDDGMFDASFCTGTLHHLSHPERGVTELTRVVRPGGRVAILEPNWKFPSVLVYSAITPAEHNTFKISPAKLEAWARAASLEDVRVERLLYTPPRPRAWGAFWDSVDRGIARVPGLRRLSIVMLVSGRVTG